MMAETQQNRARGIWIVAVVLLLLLAIYIYARANRSTVTVRVAQVERHDITRQTATNGKVVPVKDYQAHATMPAVVKDLLVDEGESVTKGQELVRLDDADARKNVTAAVATLDQAQSQLTAMERGGSQDELLTANNDLASARSQQQTAQTSLDALLQLQSRGAASASEVAAGRQKLTDAQTRVKELQTRSHSRYATTDLNAQRAQVAQAQAGLAAARSAYAGVDIRAPFAGVVYAVPVAQYDFVKDGDTLVAVAEDPNKLDVIAYFDEPEIGNLRAGEPVRIAWDAKPSRTWHGHVVSAPTTITNYGTRNVGECIIAIDDASSDLLPNTNVTVTVTTLSKPNVLSLPREALHSTGSATFVYQIVDGRLVKTPVQVDIVNNTLVQITSGLQEGDLVALGATTDEELSAGLKVKAQQ